MKKRAFWLGGILIALVVVAGIIVSFSSVPRDETGQKMNTSTEAILRPAFEVYGWFTSSPLSHESKVYSDVLPYCKVTDERFSSLKELSTAVRKIFSDSIATRLLESGLYIDIEGQLHVNKSLDPAVIAAPLSAADNNAISKEVYSVVSEDQEKIVYRAEVSYTTNESASVLEDALSYDFVYEKVNGKWVFTQFDYYK